MQHPVELGKRKHLQKECGEPLLCSWQAGSINVKSAEATVFVSMVSGMETRRVQEATIYVKHGRQKSIYAGAGGNSVYET
jgi:hypothetical protein